MPAAAVVCAAFVAVPVWVGMYAPLAAKLPAETNFLFASYRWLCFVPAALVLGVWFLWRGQSAIAAVGSGFAASALALYFGWWAGVRPEVILALIAKGNSGA